MSNSGQFHDEHERQLDAIIARYYRAVEEGHPLDQDLFVSEHPEFERDLREFFADLGHFQGAVPRAPANPALSDTVAMKTPQSTTIGRASVVRYFGEYEILEELGIGGMGVVYKARQTKLRRIVALKMIKAGELANPQEVQRFQAEAKAVARLSHPGIVAVHEVGIHQGQYFYTMDFVGGGNLSRLHRDGPVPARRAAELVRQLAEAVHYAHGKGIVHRDLKPANVLLTDEGDPRITDFGLAKRMWVGEDSMEAPLTETGQILGTAGYMSPEQAAGKTRLVGPPADIYALGSILYALLTSRAPFVGESLADTILQVIHKEPVSPHALNPSVARDLETLCLKCLAKDPHKRYGTAQLLAEDLARFLDGRPVVARPINRAARTWRWCRRNPWIAGLSAAVAASLLIGTIVASSWAVIANQNQVESDRRGRALAKSLESSQKQYEEITKLTDDRIAALDEARWQVYRLRLMRMEQLWREKDWGHLERLLSESIPAPNEKDLRGWEWYYLQSQLGRRAWRIHEIRENVVAFDWDMYTGKLAVWRSGVIEIWLPRDRRLLKSFAVPVAPSRGGQLRWAPDHRQLAVATHHVNVQIVDSETGAIAYTIADPDIQLDDRFVISEVNWSPQGDCLAVTYEGRCLQIWELKPKPVLLKSFFRFNDVTPQRINWSPDQSTCVTTSNDGWALYWRTADWSLLEKKRLVNAWCNDVDWSPDGTRVAFGSRIGVVANVDGTQTKLLPDQGASISTLRWLDSQRLVTANDAHELRVVHVDQQVPDEVFRLHAQRVSWVSIGPDEQIASVAPGESVAIGAPKNVAPEHLVMPCLRIGRPFLQFEARWTPSALVNWHPRLNVLGLVVEGKENGIGFAATWSPGAAHAETVPHLGNVRSIHWSSSGDAIEVETYLGARKSLLWPVLANGVPADTSRVIGPGYSPDGRFRVDGMPHRIESRMDAPAVPIAIVDTHAKIPTFYPAVNILYAYEWHPNEHCLAVAQEDRIHLYHTLRNQSAPVTTRFNPQIQKTRCLAWSRDGKHLLAGSSSGSILVLDGVSLEVVHTLRGHAGSLTAVAWSTNSTRIVSAGLDGFLRWWDVEKGVELFKIPITKSNNICELRFSADGHWLAGRTETGMVYIWTNEG